MINVICPRYCPNPYCDSVCPEGAIVVEAKTVNIDTDKCHGCGLCKVSCLTFSRDKGLERRSLEKMMGR